MRAVTTVPPVSLLWWNCECVYAVRPNSPAGEAGGARAWRDCLGTRGSSGEARAPEAWCGARSSRQRGVGPWAGRGPRTAQALSPPSLLLGPGVLFGESNYFILLFPYL